MKLSLHTRGLLVFVAVGFYVAAVGYVLTSERQALLQLAMEVERIHEEEAALAKSLDSLSNSMLRLQPLLFSSAIPSSVGDDVVLDLELLQAGLQELQRHRANFDDDIAMLGRQLAQLRERPSRDALVAVREGQEALDRRLDRLNGELRATRAELWVRFYHVYDRATLIAATAALVGLIVFGAIVTAFFRRLAWDIDRLEERAANIVAGYRGAALDITRSDEVGRLMSAVNRMQSDLRQREQKLEIVREQHAHREKMAALGSLATAIAHEINNPIAAIAGLAQSMLSGGSNDPRPAPHLILDQAQRIAGITRQVAEFARPRAPRLELLDLNGLVRNTCKFIAYDERFLPVRLELSLDESLPAVKAVADHVTQALMNLLINAADATEGLRERSPHIRVETRGSSGEAVLSVTDNGIGMDEDILAHAFDEAFTTKPPDHSRGLGLFISRELLERDGARIELASSPGVGTTAALRLPLNPATPR